MFGIIHAVVPFLNIVRRVWRSESVYRRRTDNTMDKCDIHNTH